MKSFLILLFAFSMSSLAGQSVLGHWKNVDDEDGKPKSIIEVYKHKDKIYGRVVELLEAATLTHCKKCKNDRKDAPITDMIIMWDLVESKNGKKATSGKILDPKSGKVYDCKIEQDGNDILKVRGYIKSPLFGRTQEWIRVIDYKNPG